MGERRIRHHKRRLAFIVKAVETRLRSLTAEDVSQSLAARNRGAAANTDTLEVVSLLLSFGTSGRADRSYHEDPWERYDRLRSSEGDDRVAIAVHDVSQIWVRRLTMHDSSRVEFQAAEARRICEILGINVAEIENEAVAALPQPKSWGLPPQESNAQPLASCESSETQPAEQPVPEQDSDGDEIAKPPRRRVHKRSQTKRTRNRRKRVRVA